jgi:hypothetical protein
VVATGGSSFSISATCPAAMSIGEAGCAQNCWASTTPLLLLLLLQLFPLRLPRIRGPVLRRGSCWVHSLLLEGCELAVVRRGREASHDTAWYAAAARTCLPARLPP